MTQRQLGFLQIILCGICFGFLGLFGKLAFAKGLTPGELLSLRYSVAGLMLFVFLLGTGQKPWRLSLKNIGICLLLGILGYAVFSFLFFTALTGISASLTVLLLYTYPAMVSLAARFFFKEHLGKQGWLALVLCLLGMLGLVWGEFAVSQPKFLWFGIGSAVFYALYILISDRVLKNVPATTSTFYISIGAGLALGALNFTDLARPLQIISENGLLIFSMSFICSLLAMTLFQAGLQKLTSSEASILSTTEPLFGVLIAILFLGERIQIMQIAGGVFVLLAMILLAVRPRT
jgi:DME family drug/metabolite transporter